MLGLAYTAFMFTILYFCVTQNLSFLKNLIIYIALCELKLAIFSGHMSFGIFLISFGLYFFTGFILLNVLGRVRDSYGVQGFVIVGIIVQELIGILFSALL